MHHEATCPVCQSASTHSDEDGLVLIMCDDCGEFLIDPDEGMDIESRDLSPTERRLVSEHIQNMNGPQRGDKYVLDLQTVNQLLSYGR